MATCIGVVQHCAAMFTMQYQLHSSEPSLELPAYACNGTHRVETVRLDLVLIFPLTDGEYQAILSLERCFYC
jgi:hypothetical protein